MKQKGSWTINFMRIYRGQKISMTGAIAKGRPLLSGAFRTEDGTGHGKFQYYVNRLKFHPGMELANGGYLPGVSDFVSVFREHISWTHVVCRVGLGAENAAGCVGAWTLQAGRFADQPADETLVQVPESYH